MMLIALPNNDKTFTCTLFMKESGKKIGVEELEVDLGWIWQKKTKYTFDIVQNTKYGNFINGKFVEPKSGKYFDNFWRSDVISSKSKNVMHFTQKS